MESISLGTSIQMVDGVFPEETCNHSPWSKHENFWLEDGSLVLRVPNIQFKVHRTLLSRLSDFISTSATLGNDDDSKGCAVITVSRTVNAEDVEALLEHLYHEVPISSDTPFPRVASVLRASSSSQLHFPAIHQLARTYIQNLFPSGPVPFFHPDYLEEALQLATEYDITSIQKGLFYSLVTMTNFATDEDASIKSSDSQIENDKDIFQNPPLDYKPKLSGVDIERCTHLMTELISHFTPILFTPAATPHMACTDVFADTWMPLVIQPALEDDGVYKPLETLERIRNIDWAKEGLCDACIIEKREEWRSEQEEVWKKMDVWLGLAVPDATPR